ncbi:hypothetical protein GOARA_065_00290 [Gordonia araii NBRC 100433]|uniref:Permease n=1 Tax=Gordonia araii NBRC 100433 TaxID=1073574 RepID=G7H5W1_9ACTN|nr:hypothetical protein [Gordonia araii]NNG95688.1 hypothetical protein [Gordonia araii NBRC 100433]GAB11236.1 hypothetical protein GOARA_065_00290 [Gordonia araii NBRC 100433]
MTNDDSVNVPVSTDPAVPSPADSHAVDTPKDAAPKGKSFGEKVGGVMQKLLLALIGVGVLIVAYFILASIAPRWWAGVVENIVGKDAGVTKGVIYGLAFGIICTLVPIVCFAMAVASWSRLKHVIGIFFLLVGIVFAIPNLLTLAVNVSDPNRSASIRSAQTRLGEIIGFQGATLVGAIVGALIAAVVVYFIVKYKVRGRKIAAASAAHVDDDEK